MREYQSQVITKFVSEYNFKKIIAGQGLAEGFVPMWEKKTFQIGLFFLFVISAILIVAGTSISTIFWLFTAFFLLYSFNVDPVNTLSSMWADRKLINQLQNFPRSHRESQITTQRQLEEIENAQLNEEEYSLLFQFCLFAPIHGRRKAKQILPALINYENLASLEFIQALARDLKVRR